MKYYKYILEIGLRYKYNPILCFGMKNVCKYELEK